MNITVKNVPLELHAKLRKAAQRSGRSLNKQILHTLDRAVNPRSVDRAQLLSRIRRRREDMEVWLDDDSLRDAIRIGRE